MGCVTSEADLEKLQRRVYGVYSVRVGKVVSSRLLGCPKVSHVGLEVHYSNADGGSLSSHGSRDVMYAPQNTVDAVRCYWVKREIGLYR